MAKNAEPALMDLVISLAKRRGFVYPSFEIYGGFAGFFDYGPYGLALKNNIKNIWWKQFVTDRDDTYGIDSVIVTKKEVLQASGHARGFADMVTECEKCKRRFRVEQLTDKRQCPECEGKLGEARHFYMMLETHVGVLKNDDSLAYLRPETAQGIFTNFKNIVDSFHPKLPFGIAQIGKAFRNEVAPRDFLFRLREIEQMEVEYFIRPESWQDAFALWQGEMRAFIASVGIDPAKVSELEVAEADRAHYSKRTIDFEFEFPFGKKELYGLAYRTDYDLKNHAAASGIDLSYLDEETGEKLVPHVIEPSLGVDRTVLAVLLSAYREDELAGEKRTYLKLNPSVAPSKVAVFPLLRNKPGLVKRAEEIFKSLKKTVPSAIFDDNGNIGKRYRRQDEIGTPYCVTIDFETIEKDAGITVRDRDTGKQERIAEKDLASYIAEKIGTGNG
ncbi:MAG: glycyl-tRNA synthetase [Candidatus Parcubacteria bacterium]|jgi:glycyl-tRNA synthetase|nr:glycyl-tRNA synthetase [Candidatus Parcubacteria bacterium]